MAVTEVTKVWSGEAGSFSKELNFEDKGRADFAEVYEVIVDDPENDNSHTVKSDSNVPQLGEQLGSQFLWVTSVSANRESPIVFSITVGYASLQLDPEDPAANPLSQPAKVKWSTVKASGEIDEDFDGNVIATPNGEPVLGITRPFSDIKATITQPFSSFNPFSFYDFIDYVNSGSYLGFPAGTGKVDTVSADPNSFEISETTVTYYDVTVEILFRNPIRTTPAKAWYNRRVLKGTKIDDGSGNIVHATDENGENVSSPVFLAEDGTEVTKENAVWVEDKVLGSANFNAMGFTF